MVALIFGIIILIAGFVVGIILSKITSTETVRVEKRDGNGNVITKTNYLGEIVVVKEEQEESCHPYAKYKALSFIAGAVLGIIVTLLGCFCSVSTGNTGVVTTFGRVENYTYEAGFHFKVPWASITEMDNRVQKSTVTLSCFSSDIQEVSMQYTINYQIDKENAQEIYRTIGKNYYITVIEPNIAEAVKVATAKFTAEQLVQTRSNLANSIETLLEEALIKYNIKVVSTAIEDMDFTDAFTNAVEAKQVAEQKKKQAEIEQAQALLQAENDKRIATLKAEADAEVAKIQAQADMEVAKIGADSAEYQGKKEASIALQRLASINGWTVISDEETGLDKLYKADGSEVTSEELKIGSENLIRYYYTQQWNGELPQTLLSDEINALFGIN